MLFAYMNYNKYHFNGMKVELSRLLSKLDWDAFIDHKGLEDLNRY